MHGTHRSVLWTEYENLYKEWGELSPKKVLEWATKHRHSAIYNSLPSQEDAAASHYLEIIRDQIQGFMAWIHVDDTKPVEYRAFASITSPEGGRTYIKTSEVLAKKDTRLDLVRRRVEALRFWYNAYPLKEFKKVKVALEELEDKYL